MKRLDVLRVMASTSAACLLGAAPSLVPSLGTAVLLQGTESLLYGPIYVARAKSYFAQEGLDLQVTLVSGGGQALAGLIGGSAQMAVAAFSVNVEAAVKGHPLLAFAAVQDESAQHLVIRKDVALKKGIGPRTSLTDRIKALRGTRIGITSPGSATDDLVRWLLVHYGKMDPDRDVEIVALHDEGTALAAIHQGAIDAMMFASPAPDRAIADGTAISLVDLARGQVPELRGFFIAVMATREYLAANAPVALAFTRGLARAERLIQTDPAAAKEAIRPYFASLDAATFDLAFAGNLPAYAKTPAITRSGVAAVVNFMTKPGEPAPNVPFDAVATNRFADGVKQH
jgi:NitT/TauT family transport system substrate-binding protein